MVREDKEGKGGKRGIGMGERNRGRMKGVGAIEGTGE